MHVAIGSSAQMLQISSWSIEMFPNRSMPFSNYNDNKGDNMKEQERKYSLLN